MLKTAEFDNLATNRSKFRKKLLK